MDRPKTKRRAAPAVFLSLPEDAIVEIFYRVPAKSLCRFKCVSKGWHDLISERLRCKKLPQTLEGFFYANNEVHGGNTDDGCGRGEAGSENPPCVRGNFINTFGRSVPLVDPSFSFLLELPCIESIGLLQSCNGLLLFGHKQVSDNYYSLGYIVCNPATEEWVSIPSSGWTPFPFPFLFPLLDLDGSDDEDSDTETGNFTSAYLIFDPAVSSHFQLVEFGMNCDSEVYCCHTYSSETGVWSEGASEWSEDDGMCIISLVGSAVVCGMVHLSITCYNKGQDQEQIVVLDGEGRKCRTMSWPEKCRHNVFIGHSQGRLHYMTENRDNGRKITELCIWVLQDYDAEEWVLKHRVSFLRLFGRMSCEVSFDYDVVTIHPDRNLVFFVQRWDRKLKSYDMDNKEVCTLRTLGQGAGNVVPYVPYFSESSAFANKH